MEIYLVLNSLIFLKLKMLFWNVIKYLAVTGR